MKENKYDNDKFSEQYSPDVLLDRRPERRRRVACRTNCGVR